MTTALVIFLVALADVGLGIFVGAVLSRRSNELREVE